MFTFGVRNERGMATATMHLSTYRNNLRWYATDASPPETFWKCSLQLDLGDELYFVECRASKPTPHCSHSLWNPISLSIRSSGGHLVVVAKSRIPGKRTNTDTQPSSCCLSSKDEYWTAKRLPGPTASMPSWSLG